MENASGYTEIAIGEFLSGSKLPVDVFIRLSQEKLIQIAKAGDSVQIERISSYESKNVTHLLIRDTDYPKYLDSTIKIAGIAVKAPQVDPNKKNQIVVKLAKEVFTELEKIGLKPESLAHAKSVMAATLVLCQAQPNLSEMLGHFVQEAQSLYTHSVAVSAISVMIGTDLNWKGVVLEKLALGGLLHDIGLIAMPPALFTKPISEFNEKELLDYQSHCVVGLNLLRSVPDMPDDVAAIAFEHHETADGRGFPRKARLLHINPLARVVALADTFVGLTTHHHSNASPKAMSAAVLDIQQADAKFWPDAVNSLKKLSRKK